MQVLTLAYTAVDSRCEYTLRAYVRTELMLKCRMIDDSSNFAPTKSYHVSSSHIIEVNVKAISEIVE